MFTAITGEATESHGQSIGASEEAAILCQQVETLLDVV